MSRLRANIVVNKDANGPFEAGEGINVAASKNIKFQSGSSLADSNNNEYVKFSAVVSGAVNEITVSNAIAAGTPSISATGNDTNISLDLISKGTGTIKANGDTVVTLDGTQTLNNKTLAAPVINNPTINNPSFGGITYVTTSGTQTLTNKTLTAPIISTISNTGTLSLPTSTDTLIGRDTVDTLTNKTLTSPKINVINNTSNTTLITLNANDVTFGTSLNLIAGSITNPAMLFTSGSLLTTQQSGAVEYASPAYFLGMDSNSGRGWIQSRHVARLNAQRSKTANTTLEGIFPVGDRSLTLTANTLYYFRAHFNLSTVSNGANSTQMQISFAFSQTQQNMYYTYTLQEGTAITTAQSSGLVDVTTGATTITVGTLSIAAKTILINIEGWFSSNASTGGTFTPSFTQTGWNGAATANKNCWIMVQPFGLQTTTDVGNWS
jgi:hypothetical protein